MPVNQAGLDHLLSWEGDVGRNVLARVIEFEDVARVNAPIRPDLPGPHLADSISHQILPDEADTLVLLVGTNPDEDIRGYAIIVHDGSKPHEIRPRPPTRRLKFKVGGKTIYAVKVNHPGTQPDPFLMRWIEILMP